MIPLEERTSYLRETSGLDVKGWYDGDRNSSYFEFKEGDRVVASTYTYNKAKTLARGIQLGRKLGLSQEERERIILALKCTTAISNDNGHDEQAQDFRDLYKKLEDL